MSGPSGAAIRGVVFLGMSVLCSTDAQMSIWHWKDEGFGAVSESGVKWLRCIQADDGSETDSLMFVCMEPGELCTLKWLCAAFSLTHLSVPRPEAFPYLIGSLKA